MAFANHSYSATKLVTEETGHITAHQICLYVCAAMYEYQF